MGKTYLYGRTVEKKTTDLFAKLTVYCPGEMVVRVRSVASSIVFESMTDSSGKAVFENITPGYWDITVVDNENAPVKRVRIDSLEYVVSMDGLSATIDIIYPAGSTCTVTNGTTTYTAPNTSGSWSCSVYGTGIWTVRVSDGEQVSSTNVNVSNDGEVIHVTLAFFSSVINVTYPVGSVCTITNGAKSYTAPDTSGRWSCTVSGTGTWTVSSTKDDLFSSKTVNVTTDGQSFNIELRYFEAIIDITYPSGSTCTVTNGTKSYTAPNTSGRWQCTVNHIGTWTVTATNDIQTVSNSVDITEDGQVSSVTLKYLTATIKVTYPNGSNCTISNGSKVYTAPDTSGSWTCTVVGSGEWTVRVTNGSQTVSDTVEITYDGQTSTVSLVFFKATINISYPSGSTCTVSDGSNTYIAPNTTGVWSCSVYNTGTWTVTANKGDLSDEVTVRISSNGQTASVTLKYFEATIDITYPVGATCKVTKGSESYTAPDTSGSWTCVVNSAGTWTVTATKDGLDVSDTVSVTKDGETFDVTLKYFNAIINITYPAGSTCTVNKGSVIYDAPNTSGSWSCVVDSAGIWTVSCTNGAQSDSTTVTISYDGQTVSTTLEYFISFIDVIYPAGSICTITNGSESYTAPDTSGTWSYLVNSAGTWTVTATDGKQTASDTVSITENGQIVSLIVMYFGSVLNIRYREGATCYIEQWDETDENLIAKYDAPDTSGKWTFVASTAGVYWVCVYINDAELDTDYVWESVEITDDDNGKTFDVVMILPDDRTYLFSNFEYESVNEYTHITGGWYEGKDPYNAGTSTYASGNMGWHFEVYSEIDGYAYYRTERSISLSNYSSLTVLLTINDDVSDDIKEYGQDLWLSVGGLKYDESIAEIHLEYPDEGELKLMLDISDISGSNWIVITSRRVACEIHEVYLA